MRPMPLTTAVEATDVVLAYDGAVALDRSTFTIPAGTITVVIGPNGSGKSTLLNGIAGLLPPRKGTLRVPAVSNDVRRISYVFQTTKVSDALPVTAREIVTMGRYASAGAHQRLTSEDHDAIERAMERTGMTGFADKHLHELSGGQRQRVFLAQGLAQDHDLLLLDEPLTGIDLPTAQAIDKVIHAERNEGCTVVFTSHDLTEAQVADHVVLLSGRVIASGPPETVLTPQHLSTAYGAALLHVDDGTVFVDDAIHVDPTRHDDAAPPVTE